jgi:CxxC-x17-CxxC domain-containing protein
MGNFRQDSRGGFGNRPQNRFGSDRPSGSRFGKRPERRDGFGRDRDFRSSERRPREMHDVTCDKCGKQCQVPFRPSGDKPVLCSDCFRNSNNSENNFSSRTKDRPSQSGISSEQFNQINAKLDKILLVLQDLELDVDGDSEDELEDEEDSEHIDNNSEDEKNEEDEEEESD